MFQSIEIERFRGFSRLALSDLGRVNLVVGENNTGKTSLLEALMLLANPTSLTGLDGRFRILSGDFDARFYRWLLKQGGGDGEAVLTGTAPDGEETRVVLSRSKQLEFDRGGDLEKLGDEHGTHVWRTKQRPLSVHAVSVQHRTPDDLVDAFAKAVRAPQDEQLLEGLLASVDGRIRSVRLDVAGSRPFIVVDVGLRERIPLSQAGQGIYRLLAIFSELLGGKPDICFIDEIENGIHYTALPTVWKGIAEVSERLGIQVFATTHSRECLVAAHECFSERESYDLRVIQLYRIGDAAEGRTLDRRHIEAAIAGDIELR